MLSEADIAFSRGIMRVRVGDRFDDDGRTWEVARFTGGSIYSPSGLGGTPIVVCKLLAGEPGPVWSPHMNDGEAEWCCDSVASRLYHAGRRALKEGE